MHLVSSINGGPRSEFSPLQFATCSTAVVVDSDPRWRSNLARTLEAAGYATDTFHDGWAGVQAVRATRPDLVTIDVTLDGIDGIEVVRQIRKAGCEAHVIFVSSTSDEVDLIAGLNAGADDYLRKPLSLREFRARIDAAARRPHRESRAH